VIYSRLFLIGIVSLLGVAAHPMGNFSVNHYARLRATPNGVDLTYVLDLAEIPTFELFRNWDARRDSAPADLDRKAAAEARGWLSHLETRSGGRQITARFESAALAVTDGAGNLPVARITVRAHLDAPARNLTYLDDNYPDRAGWKEIVIQAADGVTLEKASQRDEDISHALTAYPPDPTVAPPQDLHAELAWRAAQLQAVKSAPVIQPVAQPHPTAIPPSPATLTAKSAPAGSVVRGDYLSRFLHQRELAPSMILAALMVAFLLGAAHALTPGHGKTIVAAYLVGSRGTLKHAAFLGATVTFTHTIAVFALGVTALFLFRYVVPEQITRVLGAVSGVSIVAIGSWMLYKRLSRERHSHPHSHAHGHDHHEHGHSHHHGPGGHTHMPDEISWAGLAALGASGGLVPCESALVLLLSAIALGRAGLGLALLLSFSAGLALVLVAIGALVLYARNLIPTTQRHRNHFLFCWLPIASPAFVIAVGLVITGTASGWLHLGWMT
jgi:nickel/cobalt exporter